MTGGSGGGTTSNGLVASDGGVLVACGSRLEATSISSMFLGLTRCRTGTVSSWVPWLRLEENNMSLLVVDDVAGESSAADNESESRVAVERDGEATCCELPDDEANRLDDVIKGAIPDRDKECADADVGMLTDDVVERA
jgi:hypothetical protein